MTKTPEQSTAAYNYQDASITHRAKRPSKTECEHQRWLAAPIEQRVLDTGLFSSSSVKREQAYRIAFSNELAEIINQSNSATSVDCLASVVAKRERTARKARSHFRWRVGSGKVFVLFPEASQCEMRRRRGRCQCAGFASQSVSRAADRGESIEIVRDMLSCWKAKVDLWAAAVPIGNQNEWLPPTVTLPERIGGAA